MGYTKLFSSILASTIWREPSHVRVVWITMLAMCDQDGVVDASVPGLADMARVDRTLCEQALSVLSSPDPDSRTKDHDGRRISVRDGGWVVLNYEAYRDKQTADERTRKKSERQARWRARMAAKASTKASTKTQVDAGRRSETHSEAEAEAEAEKDSSVSPLVLDHPEPRETSPADRLFAHWKMRHKSPRSQLDKKRRALLTRQAKEHGEDICALAIDGCALTPWNMGENPDGRRFNSLGLILRDAEHIERFAETARAAGRPGTYAVEA